MVVIFFVVVEVIIFTWLGMWRGVSVSLFGVVMFVVGGVKV